jgi:hypothetical protein
MGVLIMSSLNPMNNQAAAFLAFLDAHSFEVIDRLENGTEWWLSSHYYANCRERGFCLVVRHYETAELHAWAIFEHRNVDSLCAVYFQPESVPSCGCFTVEDIPAAFYRDKYDTDFDANWGNFGHFASLLLDDIAEKTGVLS